MAAWLKNCWYVGAWSSELAEQPIGRTILDQPIVFFRTAEGVAALHGRCPHRFAPLSRGRLVEGRIECPYHGLQFGHDGMCRVNPHGDGRIPDRARVRSYAVQEKYGFIWIWLGDEAGADAALIPDYSFMDPGAGYATHGGNYLHVRANYELMTDNLMDLSHVGWLHREGLGNEFFGELKRSVELRGCDIWSCHELKGRPAAKGLRHYLDSGEANVDHWIDMRWSPASCLALYLGFTWPGRPRDEGSSAIHVHILTPETERSTHYFFGSARDFKQDDASLTERARAGQWHAFQHEDEPMIHAVQDLMGTTDLMSLRPILLDIDVGPARARRALQDLIVREQTPKR